MDVYPVLWNPKEFHPSFGPKLLRVMRSLKADGWSPKVASGHRTIEQQAKLVAEKRSKVLFSFHNATYSDGRPAALAADVIDTRWAWNTPGGIEHAFWLALGKAARNERLIWGNDWDDDGIPVGPDPDESFADVAHIQLLPNSFLKRVRNGWLPEA